MTGDWSDEETNDPLIADARNFYKVEKGTRDGDSLLCAGNLDKARGVFTKAIKPLHPPTPEPVRKVSAFGKASATCRGLPLEFYLRRGAVGMPSPEEYRQSAKEARKQANACRNQWERQGLLIVADQYERLAAYKNLTARPSRVTAPARANHGEKMATPRPPLKPNEKQAPIILGAKPL